jgi:hypothetical protein
MFCGLVFWKFFPGILDHRGAPRVPGLFPRERGAEGARVPFIKNIYKNYFSRFILMCSL